MASVKVFGPATSAEVARVLMCLFEKEVEFQLIRVDAYRGLKHMPQYLKLQPHGEALTFEDDGLTLSDKYTVVFVLYQVSNAPLGVMNLDMRGIRADSRGILRHISHKYAKQGNPDLIGMGALERASIEQWLQTEAQSFDAPSAEMVYSLALLPPSLPKQNENGNGNGNGNGREVDASTKRVAFGPEAAKQAQKEEEMLKLFEQRKKDLEKLLDIYEQRLEEAQYLAGDNFTIADLAHLPNGDRLASDPRSRRLFESRKNVSRWWHDISSRDTWQYVKSLQRPPPNGNGQQQQQRLTSNGEHGRNNNNNNNNQQQ